MLIFKATAPKSKICVSPLFEPYKLNVMADELWHLSPNLGISGLMG